MSTSNTSRRKFIYITAVLALIVLAAALIWLKRTETQDHSLILYGNVDIREVQLAFRQSGRITEMYFDEGDSVTQGTRLAKLDDQPYQDALLGAEASVLMAQAELTKLQKGLRPQEIDQSRAKLRQAQAVATNTEREFQRQSELLSRGATSLQMFESAQTARDEAATNVATAQATLSLSLEGFREEDIQKAQAQLMAAQAARDRAATDLADTELIAPSDGIIISRIREPGSIVSHQNTIYSLSLDKPVYVRAYVAEPDLGRVAPGTPIHVITDSSDKVYRGQVGFVSPRAEFTPKTVETSDLRTDLVYRIRIVINTKDTDQSLRQGMPVTVIIPNSSSHADQRKS